MSGWYAQDCARWDRTRQRLLAHGPLDEEDARNDLACRESLARLWIAEEGRQGERWLGRSAFARRWGWTEQEVRTLIARDDWHDALNPVPAAVLASTVIRARPMDITGSAPGQHRVNTGSAPGQVQTNAEESQESTGSAPGEHRVSTGSTTIRAVPSPQDHKITRSQVQVIAPADAAPPETPAQPPVSPEPVPSPPTTAPTKAPKAKPPTVPGYHEAISLWTRLHREAFPGVASYPWVFTGPNADGGRVKVWLAAVRIGAEASPERVAEGLAGLETGMRAYLGRAAVGTAWPRGEPASTRHFTRDLSTWLQTDPDATATGPPSKMQATIEGTERFRQRHQSGESPHGIF